MIWAQKLHFWRNLKVSCVTAGNLAEVVILFHCKRIFFVFLRMYLRFAAEYALVRFIGW